MTDPATSPDPVEQPFLEAVDAPDTGVGAIARQHPVIVYSLLRIALLLAVGAVMYLLGLRDVWLILFAFLVSGLLSAFVLSRPREGAALGLTTAYRGINSRIDATARAEDDDEDFPDAASGAGSGAGSGAAPDGPPAT